MRKRIGLLGFLLIFFVAAPARAELITYYFQGIVNVYSSITDIPLGSVVSGYFTYDTETSLASGPEQSDPYEFANHLAEVYIAIGDTVFYTNDHDDHTGSGSLRLYFAEESVTGRIDVHGRDITDATGLELDLWYLTLAGSSAITYDDMFSIPVGLSLDDFTGSLIYLEQSDINYLFGTITYFSNINPSVEQASPTPEPGTVLLMGAGLAGLILLRQRRRKA